MLTYRKVTSMLSSSIVILSMVLSGIQPMSVSAQGTDGIHRDYNAETGKVSRITGDGNQPIVILGAMSSGMTERQRSDTLLQRFAPEFGLTNPAKELRVEKTSQPSAGRVTTRYQQVYQGVPVIAGELIVNASEQGALYSMNGEVSQGLSLDTSPALSVETAISIAQQGMVKWYGGTTAGYIHTQASLFIFDESLLRPSNRPVELVWQIEMLPAQPMQPIRELVLVNAKTGNVPLHFNQIDNAWSNAKAEPIQQKAQDINPTETPIPTETPLATETPIVTDTPIPTETPLPTETLIAPTETPMIDTSSSDVSALAVTTWYVATTGDDSNSCAVEGSPCLTIDGAIGKASDDDTIKVASGTYTGTGTEVVLINKSVTISGGWDTTFTTQNGMSTIDGENTRTGVNVSGFIPTPTALIESFVIQKGSGYGGLFNGGTLTLNNSMITNNIGSGIYTLGTMIVNNSTISGNKTLGTGGGIYNSSGMLTLNNSTVRDNVSSSYGGGIFNASSTLTLNNSSVIGNIATGTNGGGGIFHCSGCTLTINNSTISGNTALNAGGGGILNVGTLLINNTTISNNKAKMGGGINMNSGSATLQNTILAMNNADTTPDCSGTVISSGYNLIGNNSGCTFTSSTGDQLNVNPQLGTYPIGSPSYLALLTGSPAIDAGNPATCLATDQRGISRPQGSVCDVGAYEYKTPGSAATFGISMGDNQKAAPLLAFPSPLVVYVVDSSGSPVSGVTITFTAPGSGVSGTFDETGTNVTTASTNNSGVAVASTFTANSQSGSYNVTATASGLAGSVNFPLINAALYVAPTGSNSNNCISPATPCLTINGALSKAVHGDTIMVATGTYTGSGTEVVLINKSVTVSGGWDASFTTLSGSSTINGQLSRRGVTVNSGSAVIERFTIQNGYAQDGGGILIDNSSSLTLNNSIISSNTAASGGGIRNNGGTLIVNTSILSGNVSNGSYTSAGGGGIQNGGTLLLNDSTIKNNTTVSGGSGIHNPGTATINRSTISNNKGLGIANDGGYYGGAAILNINNSTISGNSLSGITNYWSPDALRSIININNSTISNNFSIGVGGIANQANVANVKIQNSILALNTTSSTGPDCNSITSLGYNIIGNTSGCTVASTTGDRFNVNPLLTGSLVGSPLYHLLLLNSPAIDAGNPSTCLSTDQRGVTRPQGAACDIGAIEYKTPDPPVSITTSSGTPQSAHIFQIFPVTLQALVLDSVGIPVNNINVTFSAPTSGASGTFQSGGTTANVVTDGGGIAEVIFKANLITGSYTVSAAVTGIGTPANFSLTNTSTAFTPLLRTYTAGGGTSLPGTLLCNEIQDPCTSGLSNNPDANSAHAYAKGTYELYATKHYRDSLNDNGMIIISTVDYCSPSYCPYPNAFWSGTQMVYGDNFPLADDVVAHELTHGVTQYESNLFYFYQSGAINEAFSDLWGEYYDQTNGLGTDIPAVKWRLGEDTLPGGTGAIRSMSNPPLYNDPDKMTSSLYVKTDADNGGVHTNSGVNNKAVFLMVDGGTFNSKTVTGIGWDKTAAIYYEVNTNLLTSGSDYSDLYFALQQACAFLAATNFKGITNADCIQVKNAIDAVQMNSQPVSGFNPDALACPAGASTGQALNLFSDNFESGVGNWTTTGFWSLEDFYATSPTHHMYGDDYYTSSLSSLQTNTGVTLPAGTSYLYFKHAFAFEYENYLGTNYYYDGAVLEYSINNGSTWVDAAPLFSDGKNYNGTIFNYLNTTNQLKGRSGFVGDSHGYVSSRYNLTSQAGKTVKFRWSLATDNSSYYLGWLLDDVKVYTCTGTPSIPALLLPANNILTTDYTPLLDWSDATPALHHYQVQVDDNPDFSSTVYDVNNLVTSQYQIPAELDPDKTYYWRVNSFNALDGTLGWSLVRTFRTALTPPILAPVTLPVVNNRPVFDWSDVLDTTNYTIQISTVNTFASFVVNTTAMGSIYNPIVDLPTNKLIYWRVRSNGANGPSDWATASSSFTTANPPSVPALVAPLDKALTTDNTPKLDWANSTVPLLTSFDHYHLQIATDASFSTLVDEQNISSILNSEYTSPADLPVNAAYYWRVRSYNTDGHYSAWSLVRSFRTALPYPTLSPVTLPLENNRPTFNWSDVPGAAGYTLQVSTLSTFASFVLNASTASSTYTPVVDLPANQLNLYWRVIANGVNGPSLPSSFLSFATLNPPSIPALAAPADNLLITNTLTPKLDWANSTVPVGVTFGGYQLRIATDADFSDIVLDQNITTGISSSEYTLLTPLLQDTKYYWHVRSYDDSSHFSSWSVRRSFRMVMPAPTLTQVTLPLVTNRPVFDWDDVTGASGYTIQVSMVESFASFVLNASTASSTYTPTTDLPANKTLYWRVISNGANGPSLPSDKLSFATVNPPSIPALSAPADNLLITNTFTPKLDWANSTVPVGVTFDHYQLRVATDAAFSAIVLDQNVNGITSSEFTLVSPLLQNTKYYWQVRAFNSIGQFSSWSLPRSFRMVMPAPNLISPSGSLLTNRPTFDWDDVAGATSYTIQVSAVNTFASFLLNSSAPSSTYTPVVDLPASKALFWRVISNGLNGPSAPSTSPLSFTTAAPPSAPVLSAPVDNLLIANTLLPKLDWVNSTVPAGSTFDHYQLQVSTDLIFSDIVLDQNVNGLASSEFTLVSPLSQNTKYYWHVRSYNSLGQFSGWSLVRSFRIALPAPILVSPIGSLPTSDLTPTFDWNDVTGATYYSLQISTSSTFTSTLVSTTAPSSTFTPAINLPVNTALYWRVLVQGLNGPGNWSTPTSFIIQ